MNHSAPILSDFAVIPPLEAHDNCMYMRFVSVASVCPDNIALFYGDKMFSYMQLHHAVTVFAQQLSPLLKRNGDNSDSEIVALAMPRGPEMIVAMLATLKLGAAYLPLDMSLPTATLKDQMAQANVEVVLNCHEAAFDSKTLQSLSYKTLLNLNIDELLAENVTHLPTDSAKFDASIAVRSAKPRAAYVIYTAGADGQQQGVIAPHRGVLRLVCNANYLSITSSDRFLQFSPTHFDAATFEIWGALLNGAGLVLYPANAFDPNLFATEITQKHVTVLWLTPALLHLTLGVFTQALEPVQTILTGGDAIQAEIVNRFLKGHPKVNIINVYGPPENTTFTSFVRFNAQHLATDNVPLGMAISETRLLLRDEQGAFVPLASADGKTGELALAGSGVALGYLQQSQTSPFVTLDGNDDAEANSAFIDSSCVYCTGDIVQQDASGDWLLIGRKDDLVKVRGYRVSLGEVKNALVKIDAVCAAEVRVLQVNAAEQLLIASVQVASNSNVTQAMLKSVLAEQLPSYMVPDRFDLSEA